MNGEVEGPRGACKHRTLRDCFVVALLAMTVSAGIHAQSYPTKPIRIVVPFAAGGIADFAARSVSQRLSESLAGPVIVDNRPGAGGITGSEIVAKSPADGHTVLVTSISHTINLSVHKNVPFDTRRDFIPVALIADAPNMLVAHPSLPVRSVKDLIALARARPKEILYGSSGSGTSVHLSAELFKVLTNTDMVHVPYKSGGLAVTELLGGHVQVMFATLPTVLGYAKSDRLRALAVTSGRRFAGAPQFPTMIEAGVPGYDVSGWTGMFLPAGTSTETVKRLAAETAKILASQKTKELFLTQGAEPGTKVLEDFAAFVDAEIVKWKKVVDFAHAKVD